MQTKRRVGIDIALIQQTPAQFNKLIKHTHKRMLQSHPIRETSKVEIKSRKMNQFV